MNDNMIEEDYVFVIICMEESWEVGRWVVELKLFVEGLKECIFCKELLSFILCIGEKKYGLVYIFYVVCWKCGIMNFVFIGKCYSISGKGLVCCFDINIKMVKGL